MQLSMLRFVVGEQNFASMHYFKSLHEKAIAIVDEHDKARNTSNTNKGNN